jgi:hypothetical protein
LRIQSNQTFGSVLSLIANDVTGNATQSGIWAYNLSDALGTPRGRIEYDHQNDCWTLRANGNNTLDVFSNRVRLIENLELDNQVAPAIRMQSTSNTAANAGEIVMVALDDDYGFKVRHNAASPDCLDFIERSLGVDTTILQLNSSDVSFSGRTLRTDLTVAGGTVTLDDSHHVYRVTSDLQTVTLPDATALQGKTYTIVNKGIYTTTIAATGSDTVDGSASVQITTDNEHITVKSDGDDLWMII